MSNERTVQRVLVVTAHPDDVDFGAGGTVATLTDSGVDVAYCIVTDGDAGGFDPAIARSEIPRIRREEQTAAAKELGVHELRFLGYPDGALEATLSLRKDISREIRRYKPDVVLCQSPVRDFGRIFGSHPDHLAAAEATMGAVYPDARNPFTFTDLLDDGFEPHSASQIWIMGGPTPNKWVDTTDQFDRKIRALLCHESQHANPEGMTQRIRAWNESVALTGGFGPGRTAELFQVVETA